MSSLPCVSVEMVGGGHRHWSSVDESIQSLATGDELFGSGHHYYFGSAIVSALIFAIVD